MMLWKQGALNISVLRLGCCLSPLSKVLATRLRGIQWKQLQTFPVWGTQVESASVHNTLSIICGNKYAWYLVNMPILSLRWTYLLFAQLLVGKLQVYFAPRITHPLTWSKQSLRRLQADCSTECIEKKSALNGHFKEYLHIYVVGTFAPAGQNRPEEGSFEYSFLKVFNELV